VAVLFRHNNIFVIIRQVAPVPACWLFKTSATSWPFDLESGVRVTCDVGYFCANFSLPRPLCSRLRLELGPMYATDRRQTSDRRQTKTSLNASALWGGGLTRCAGGRHNMPLRPWPLTFDLERGVQEFSFVWISERSKYRVATIKCQVKSSQVSNEGGDDTGYSESHYNV